MAITADDLLAEKNSERFEEILARELADETSEVRQAVPRLFRELPTPAFHTLIAIERCGEFEVLEAAQSLREVLESHGAGLRNAREAALYALAKILPSSQLAEVLVATLGDRDAEVAETAALIMGRSDDSVIVPHLLRWLEMRMQGSRSKVQARRTGEAIATVKRLGSAKDHEALARILNGIKLTKLEVMAWSGAYRGQKLDGQFPMIVWPV